MSYMRNLSPHYFVDGISEDYIFESSEGIEDYGSMSNEAIVELLLRFGERQEDLILTQMGKRLAENSNIKLRKKKLTDEEWNELWYETHKKAREKYERLGVRKR